MNFNFFFVIVLLNASYNFIIGKQIFEEVFKWKQINYVLPENSGVNSFASTDFYFPGAVNTERKNKPTQLSNSTNVTSRNDLQYIPYNNVPMGVSRYKDKLFITIPRRRPGIPFTLNYVSLTISLNNNLSPKLEAFPSYNLNLLNQQDKNKIISVYRTRPDYKCGRLWFVDTGVLEYPSNIQQIQQPSIWILDLENNNNVIRRFEIPSSIVTSGRGLASITIDVNDNCNDAYAYIPDLQTYHLYVYSFRTNSMWSFSHNYFSFDPLAGDLNIGGAQFQWNDGIFSITIGNSMQDGFKKGFFHPMASSSEFLVSTKVLHNRTNAERSWHGEDFKHLGHRGLNKQSTMHDFHLKSGVIFYAEIQNNGIGCWNTNKEFCDCNHGVLQTNENDMIYPSDLSIDNEDNIWIMTNTMPRFIYGSLNPNEYNFRIWTQNAFKAVKGSVCE